MKRPFLVKLQSLGGWLPAAALSGFLLSLVPPPVSAWWLVWIGLVPMLWLLHQAPPSRRAFLIGFTGGLVYCFLILRPLVSAHLWTGWQEDIDIAGAESQQYRVLVILWFVLAAWGALFWGVFAVCLARLAQGSLTRLALLAPPLLVLIAEFLRSVASWNYQWGFLGNALVASDTLRQLAAFGGASLLTWVAVLGNVGLLALLLSLNRAQRRAWRPAAFSFLTIAVAMGVGYWQIERTERLMAGQAQLRVGALQYHQKEYYWNDYIAIGMERQFVDLISQITSGATESVDLLVLPESIAVTALSLDGSRSTSIPEDMQFSIADWAAVVLGLMDLSDHRIGMVMGLTTIQNSKHFNSMVYWGPFGVLGHYHKQHLVPFAENSPALVGWLGLRGRSQYQPGTSNKPIQFNNMLLGTFICQEVLISQVTRQAVRHGAQILISGGNDGVFADPAVAQIHGQLAQLRAVETGRYVVRAMKTGVSAIIDPTGREVARSPGSEPHFVVSSASPLNHQTLFVRTSNWVLFAAAAIILALGSAALLRSRKKPRQVL